MANTTARKYSTLFLKIVENSLATLGENQASKEAKGVQVFNEDYTDLSIGGGKKAITVEIPVEGNDPTVRDYVIASGITPENIDGSNLTLTITGDHAINELLDGYEIATVPAKVVARRMARAARAMAKKIDADAITTLEASTNIKPSGTWTKANAYESVTSGTQKGQEDGVDFTYLITKPSNFRFIKLDPSFVKNSDLGMTLAKTGYVGMVDGYPIIVTNGLATTTNAILGTPEHATRVMALKYGPKLVNLDGDANFINAMAIKGRFIFKHMITNVKGVLVLTTAAVS